MPTPDGQAFNLPKISSLSFVYIRSTSVGMTMTMVAAPKPIAAAPARLWTTWNAVVYSTAPVPMNPIAARNE